MLRVKFRRQDIADIEINGKLLARVKVSRGARKLLLIVSDHSAKIARLRRR